MKAFKLKEKKEMYSDKFLTFIKMWEEEFAIARSIDEKVCEDKDGNPIPWYTYPAIEYLDQFDYSDKSVFEFGCGNSSKFWAARAKKVVSIEDNLKWFEKWQTELVAPNLQVLWRDEGEIYENAILETDENFDVIIVDGKRREKCCETACKRLAKGGIIILDDSDRINTSEEYRKSVAILKSAGLLQVDFYGFCPMNNYTKNTSLFFSRDFDFKTIAPIQPINGIGNLWSMGRKNRKEFYKNNK